MGLYSFTKADVNNTAVANVLHGAPFKMLIPKEYGGGYIKDHYVQSGKISDGNSLYDIFELLAFWNKDMLLHGRPVGDYLLSDAGQTAMKPVDIFTSQNRKVGIAITGSDDQMDALPFPLKIVSWSYKGSYEDCPACSYTDPYQGCNKMSWKVYDNCKVKNRQLAIELTDITAPCESEGGECDV